MSEPVCLDEMERIAKEATDGPWSVVAYGDGDSLAIHEGRDWRICFMATPGETMGAMERIEANAEFIATFDPPTVLSLLSHIRGLRTALEPFARRAWHLPPDYKGGVYLTTTGPPTDDPGRFSRLEAAHFRQALTSSSRVGIQEDKSRVPEPTEENEGPTASFAEASEPSARREP